MAPTTEELFEVIYFTQSGSEVRDLHRPPDSNLTQLPQGSEHLGLLRRLEILQRPFDTSQIFNFYLYNFITFSLSGVYHIGCKSAV
jgi:hypothetical protein